eukprot:TRINITY_DN1447_c0_g1_i1.p1 TRINITY_DN1447_c0_g1~~TRINITY_DN1447_c0_g1_i1.p1  ORF type:complete len:414 (+),score=81.93 TRINITY_DN1447_c0_g1_i1:159-1400(+)
MGCASSKRPVEGLYWGTEEELEEKKAEYEKMVELATREKEKILVKKAEDEKYWEEIANENRSISWKCGGEEALNLQRQNCLSGWCDLKERVEDVFMDEDMEQQILDCICGAGSLVTFHPLTGSSPSKLRSPDKLLYPGEFLGARGSFGARPLLSLELRKNPVSGVVRDPVTKKALMLVIREPVVDLPNSISSLLKRRKGPAALLHTNGTVVGALYSQALPRSATQNCEWGAKAYALDVRQKPELGHSSELIPLVVYEWWRGKGEPMLLGFFIRNPDGTRGEEIALHKTEHDADETNWMNSSVLEVFDRCPADPMSLLIFAWFLFYTEVPPFAVARPGIHYTGSPTISPIITPLSNSSARSSFSSTYSSPLSLPETASSTAPSSPPHLSLSPISPLNHCIDDLRQQHHKPLKKP